MAGSQLHQQVQFRAAHTIQITQGGVGGEHKRAKPSTVAFCQAANSLLNTRHFSHNVQSPFGNPLR